MEQRTLGSTDLTVSRACLGTMTFGGQVDEAEAAAMVDDCLERGVNFFDTANIYTGGRSEEILGRILRGRRDQVVLATKVGIKAGDDVDQQGLSRAAILRGIDESLRRLQTEYVDLYYMHTPDYQTPLEETLETLDGLVRAGKVRALGASNYASWQVCRMLWLAEARGWEPVRVTQPMYNVLARGIEQEFLPMCREFGLASVVYNPLAGGLLTGKHRPEAPLPGTRFDKMPVYRDRYWHGTNFEAVEELEAAARAAGRTPISLALNWVLHHTAADGVILGASSRGQLRQNLDALEEGPLAPETVEVCDGIWRALRGVTPQYNR